VLGFFLFVRIPIFLARRSRSMARLRLAVRSVTEALGWNIRDARANGSWRRQAIVNIVGLESSPPGE
jgi:hypothetical protein